MILLLLPSKYWNYKCAAYSAFTTLGSGEPLVPPHATLTAITLCGLNKRLAVPAKSVPQLTLRISLVMLNFSCCVYPVRKSGLLMALTGTKTLYTVAVISGYQQLLATSSLVCATSHLRRSCPVASPASNDIFSSFSHLLSRV